MVRHLTHAIILLLALFWVISELQIGLKQIRFEVTLHAIGLDLCNIQIRVALRNNLGFCNSKEDGDSAQTKTTLGVKEQSF